MEAQDLGEIRKEFKPGLENLIAGTVIGLLLFGGGCAAVFFSAKGVVESHGDLPVWAERGWCWGAAAIFTALGIGLVVGGFFLIRWMRSLSSLRVRVGRNGFAVTERDVTRVFAWQDILSVQETHLYERPPILKGVAKYALPKMLSKSFLVVANGRQGFGFDGNTIKGHTKLAQLIKAETDRLNIPWEVVEEHAS
jgi:hypothetical protein